MMHLLSARSRSLFLRPFVLALVLSQIMMYATIMLNYNTFVVQARSLDGIPVKYLNLYFASGTQAYKVMFPLDSKLETSQCVNQGVRVQKWDATFFTFYTSSSNIASIASESNVTVFPYTKPDCSDSPAPPSMNFRIPSNASSDTCRVDLVHQRVSWCTKITTLSVNTVVVYPPTGITVVELAYQSRAISTTLCKDKLLPGSWATDTTTNTFVTRTAITAASTIELTTYKGTLCSAKGDKGVTLPFTIPDVGKVLNPICWADLASNKMTGCNTGN